MTGSVDFERFFIVGVLASILGTFFVFWHPIQWMLDRIMLSRKKSLGKYKIEYPNHVPPQLNIIIDESLIRISLHTYAIKYQKDKFAGLIYFIIILFTLTQVSLTENFQQLVQLQDSAFLSIITFGPVVLMVGIGVFLHDHQSSLYKNIQLNSLYFQLSNTILGYGNESNLIKTSIDLNDWTTAKTMIDKQIRIHWAPMISQSEEKEEPKKK